ncbi:MAG: POTRA domain-containing protein [Bacteroidota bacterium]|nr:POTRA domain-containing protein [Bacteroidota bacterium]MDP4230538.1 POTRA domain-containing protein [Bacteroidota bacterium]MDP4236129.1 POTRA domain-containing protein [Bacteroidota bacterium]
MSRHAFESVRNPLAVAALLLCLLSSNLFCQQRYTIHSLHIHGATDLASDDLLQSFSTKIGDTLRENIFEKDIDALLRHFEEIGFPLAKITIDKILPHDSSSLDITLLLEPGKHPHLVAVKVIGNAITDSTIIAREFFINEKPLFDKKSIEASRNRIERLGIFAEVSAPEIYVINDSSVGISIAVSENRSTYIDGILGYNPPPVSGASGYVSGFLSLGFTNIAGTARNASFEFRRETKSAQELSAQYREPWIFGLPINMSVEFLQRDEDSIYTRTNAGIEPSLLLSNGFSLSASLSYDRIIPGSAHIVYDSRTYTVGVQGKLDTRDNLVAPRSGFMLSLGGSYGAKSVSGATSFDSLAARNLAVRTLTFDGGFAIRTFSERLVFVPSVSAKMTDITNGELDESDLFRIGGLRTLRGYFESEFHISRLVILHADERLMTGHNSFLGIFMDYGYLTRPATTTFAAQTLYPLGYGVVFQFDTQLGLLSASIGLAKGETIDRAKLHFGIIKDF